MVNYYISITLLTINLRINNSYVSEVVWKCIKIRHHHNYTQDAYKGISDGLIEAL
jgi:hypothetical protein